MEKPTRGKVRYNPEDEASRRPVAMIEVTKVVREFHPVLGGDMTHGQILDAKLQEAAMNGQEVQTISIHIERDDWREFAENVQREGNPYSFSTGE